MSIKATFSIFVSLLIFVVLTIFASIILTTRINEIRQQLIKADSYLAEKASQDLAANFADYYYYSYDTYVNIIKDYFKRYPDILRFKLYNTEGELLFDTVQIGKSTERVVGEKTKDKKILNIINSKKIVEEIVTIDGQQVIRIYNPYFDKFDNYRNMIEFHFSLSKVKSTIRESVILLIGGLVIFLIVSIASTWVVINQLLKPITVLTEAAKDIATGNFNRVVQVSDPRNEIGILSSTFNLMTSKLKNYYRDLETDVKKKTAELAERTEALAKQNLQLEESKNAMINLLEDEKKLEEALKIEKASVEKKVIERTKDLVAAKEKISEGWLQIQKEKAKLTASIENMPLGFVMVDVLGNVLVTNSNAQRILGSKNNEEVYFKAKEILKAKIDVDDYLKSCDEKTITNIYSDIGLTDGRFLKISLSPIITTENNINKCIGIVILVEDITEAKIMERSKDEFFSIASHELRTPLTAIKGNTSLIEQYYSEQLKDQELKDMIADIHESSSRLIGIVNDFLDVSRLEQGKIEFKKQSIDIAKLIDEVLKEYQTTGSQKKLILEYKKDSKVILPFVFADPDKVKQVLINLIGNSLKFTTQGGIYIYTQSIPGFVKVLVSDSGRGIPPEGQKLLFRKFQQAGNSLLTRDTTKGTGLGLYISRLIVTGMGGEIKLESSTVGKGSIFSFTLPIATQEQMNGSAVKTTVKIDTTTGLTQKVA